MNFRVRFNLGAITSPKLAYLMIGITVLLWAIGVVIARGVGDNIPLIGLTFWRWLLAAVILLPFVWKEVWANKDTIQKYWRLYLLQGTFMVGGGTLLFTSLYFTTAINASLVNTAQPALTTLLTWIVLKERLRGIQYFGILSASVGVLFMIFKADFNALVKLDFNMGDLIVVMAITSYSMYAINLRKLPRELGTFATLFVILFFGTFPVLPFYIGETLLFKAVPFNFMTGFWAFILAITISIAAIALWNNGNRIIGPQRASVFINLMPVYGAALAMIFLGEELFLYHIIGAIFVCSGIFLVVRK
ncbi:MAG: DMT family transporter [Rhodospirillales bacterium]|nr:DMT family transporter [Rhodospirillales bacterium]